MSTQRRIGFMPPRLSDSVCGCMESMASVRIHAQFIADIWRYTSRCACRLASLRNDRCVLARMRDMSRPTG